MLRFMRERSWHRKPMWWFVESAFVVGTSSCPIGFNEKSEEDNKKKFSEGGDLNILDSRCGYTGFRQLLMQTICLSPPRGKHRSFKTSLNVKKKNQVNYIWHTSQIKMFSRLLHLTRYSRRTYEKQVKRYLLGDCVLYRVSFDHLNRHETNWRWDCEFCSEFRAALGLLPLCSSLFTTTVIRLAPGPSVLQPSVDVSAVEWCCMCPTNMTIKGLVPRAWALIRVAQPLLLASPVARLGFCVPARQRRRETEADVSSFNTSKPSPIWEPRLF